MGRGKASMYTIGQVAKFLGVSRDTLKYYEEKQLVNPKKDKENNYRKYTDFDIQDVIITNFYRNLDLEVKTIQDIKQGKDLDGLDQILEEKALQLKREIEEREHTLQQIQFVKQDIEKVKKHLGTYTIQAMPPFIIKAELSSFSAYDEYELLQGEEAQDKRVSTLEKVRRVVTFDTSGILKNQFVVVEEDYGQGLVYDKKELINYDKCLYIIIEDGRCINGEKSIDVEIGEQLWTICHENHYEPLGIVYAGILLTTYEEGLEKQFLEIYAPIR